MGGEARVVDVAKHIWAHHDMRWVADKLRKANEMRLSGKRWAVR